MELLGVGQRRPSKIKRLMAAVASMLGEPSWLLKLSTSTRILVPRRYTFDRRCTSGGVPGSLDREDCSPSASCSVMSRDSRIRALNLAAVAACCLLMAGCATLPDTEVV